MDASAAHPDSSTGTAADLVDMLARNGAWSTLYVDGPDGAPVGARAARRSSIADRLRRAGAAPAEVEAALGTLSDEGPPAPSAHSVLVRDAIVELDEYHTGERKGPELITHGRVPRIVPLLRGRGQEILFLRVEVARDGGTVRLAHGGRQVEQVAEIEGRDDYLHKVHAGGWSQARYQRHAEEVWRENADAVAAAVDRLVREHQPAFVVVSGDVRAREKLLSELGEEARDLVVEVAAHTRAAGASEEQVDETIETTLEQMQEREVQYVLDRVAANAGQRGARGVGAIVHALQQAQVDAIVLDPRGDDRSVLALDASPWIATDPGEALTAVVLEDVPALEGLARAAVLTGARVLFRDLEPVDPAAPRPSTPPEDPVATLRWPTGPDQP